MQLSLRWMALAYLVLVMRGAVAVAQTPPPVAPPAGASAPSDAPADAAPTQAVAPEGDAAAVTITGAPADPVEESVAPVAEPAPSAAPAAVAEPTPVAEPAPAPMPEPLPAPPYVEPADEPQPERAPCLLGKVCLGPVLTLGAFNAIGFGVHARLHEHFGLALDYQFLPSITIDDKSAGMSLFTLQGRWHVGGSSFFLALGFSYQSFYAEGTVSDESTGQSARLDASVGIPQFMFGLGVLGGEGFVLGIDLAFGIPLGGKAVEFSSMNPGGALGDAYAEQQRSIEDTAETLLELLPITFQINILRLGFLF